MTKIVLVEKTGNKKTLNAKDLARKDLYKKCGFRKTEGFALRHSWKVEAVGSSPLHTVEVWARDTGRANTENKYDLPPPIDTDLYFGTMAVVGVDCDGELIDLDKESWEKVYEQLFGGFDDLDDDDDDEEDELEHIPKELKTKVGGYMKDGFVVDADEESEEEGEGFGGDDDDDEESAEEDDEDDDEDEDEDDDYELSDVGSELQEEDYMYSDDE